MDHDALEERTPGRGMAVDNDRNAAHIVHEIVRKAIGFGAVKGAILLPCDCALVGVTKPCRGFDQGVQNGGQIKGGAADDLEDLGSGGLLPQRFRYIKTW